MLIYSNINILILMCGDLPDQWAESDDQFRDDMQSLIESTPAAARIAEVDDIAPLVAFLCTDDARWTTGSVLSANGGLYN